MGGLFSRSRKPFRILMVGLDGAGKTTCLYQLKMGQSVPTIPTVGFNVETVRYRGSMFSVWDVGGQDKLRGLWAHYYAEADGIIFMIDSSDRERLKEAKAELYGEDCTLNGMGWDVMQDYQMMSYFRTHGDKHVISCTHVCIGLMSDPMAHRAVVLVLGNKVDVKGAIKPDELVQSLELGRCHPTRSTHIMSCCGKSGQGLREGLDWLITKLERPKPQKLKPTKQSSKSKSKSNSKSKSKSKSSPHISTPTKTSFST